MNVEQEQRRFRGYRTESSHGLIGSFTVYNLLVFAGAVLLGLELGKRIATGPMQTLVALGCGLLSYVLTVLARRMVEGKPKYLGHAWRFWSGEDANVVAPDRRPVPLILIEKTSKEKT